MKLGSALALTLSALALASASSAHADDKAACLDAASKGQKLRNAHALVEARDQLRICAAAACPNVVQSDCVNWLADVEKALPTVVVSAKDAAGVDLIEVTVTVDGKPFTTKLTGQAMPMNAGPHAFHFELTNGTTLDRQLLVKEGGKEQPVAVVVGPVAAPLPAEPVKNGSSLRTAGWILGGVGVAGLAVGIVAGVVAVSDKNGARCVGDVCQGSVSGIKSAAAVSDVGWIAGGVLLAGGAGLVLFAPKGKAAPTTGLRLVPMLTTDGGQVVAGGSF